MTTFGEIHSNAEGYRNEFRQLNDLVLRVAQEKAKGEPLVTWFRLRNRRIEQVLDPMKEELQSRIKEEKQKRTTIRQSSSNLKRVMTFVERGQLKKAEHLLNEVIENVLEESIHLTGDIDSSKEVIESVKRQVKVEQEKASVRIKDYETVMKQVTSTKELFSSTRTTKEIDVPAFSEAIQRMNQQIQRLDIQVPELKELPEMVDKQAIEALHGEIRAVVQEIDSRYPMKLFAKPLKTIRTVIHDVGNDRGRRAFQNRSKEIIEGANEALETFNGKYWQITGQRWERVGRNQWGYKEVKATHPKIQLI